MLRRFATGTGCVLYAEFDMFDFIRGKLVSKMAAEVVVDVRGIGYLLRVSMSTSEQLPEEENEVTLKTWLHVREDIFQLYGFANEDERTVFKALIAISGVGPKLAQTILSGLSTDRLVTAIQNRDEATLNSISGVGKKTAQRLIVELKDKLAPLQTLSAESATDETMTPDSLEREALMALMSLGYSRQKAEKAVLKIRKSGKVLSSEEMIKKALQTI